MPDQPILTKLCHRNRNPGQQTIQALFWTGWRQISKNPQSVPFPKSQRLLAWPALRQPHAGQHGIELTILLRLDNAVRASLPCQPLFIKNRIAQQGFSDFRVALCKIQPPRSEERGVGKE